MKPLKIQRRAYSASAVDWPSAMHPVLQRVLALRGVTSLEQIQYRLNFLHAPESLGGLERACDLLEKALREDARIVIVGDFDCDGATGAAVAVRGLRMLGARQVGYGVPNRFTHGYGLSAALVAELAAGKPQLLITVDNGIAAHAGVAAAKALDMQVIITDHHLAGDTLPDADAIVNPNLEGDAFPSKALAGVGVMFYLLLALRARLRANGWFSKQHRAEPDLSTLLDLVALGTVADLVPLDRNNRILIQAGLRRIRSGSGCAGIRALLESGKRDAAQAVASDLGFVVAPRINAAGRLEDIRLGIECLLSDDIADARSKATRLSAINAERRDLQTAMVEQAEASVRDWMSRNEAASLPVGVVLFEPGWHHGVVGLVASKLKDILHRPVFACAPAGADSDELKASGRSIAGFHLRDALAAIEANNRGLLGRYGGHAMAAGLTLHRDALSLFASAFDAVARERIPSSDLDALLLSDGELSGADFCMDLARDLRDAGPWGQEFPEPLFDGIFDVVSWKVMGQTHLRLQLRAAGIGQPITAVMFNCFDGTPPPDRMRAAYQLGIDDWNDRLSLRILLRHFEAA